MISESKVNDSFPDGQLFLDGFGTAFRPDRNRNGGGIMLFIRNEIPAEVVFLQKFLCRVKFSKKKKVAIELFLQP